MADDVNQLCGKSEVHERWKFTAKIKNAAYSPELNCIIAPLDNGYFEVLDIHSGELLASVQTDASKGVGIHYLETSDKLIVYDANRLGCRGVHRECILLESILQVANKHGSEGCVKVELDLVQAGVLISGFQSCQPGLQTSEFSEIVHKSKAVLDALEASYEAAVRRVKDASNVAVQWVMVCIEMDLQLLYSVFNNLLFVMKWEYPGPALPIVGELLYRIVKLQGSKRDSTLSEKSLMFSEVERLETFAVWPHKNYRWALPQPMAEAGFYHPFDSQGAEDRVMCFTCTVCLVSWEPSDQPWSEHERHSSGCPFVKKKFSENVPTTVCSATDCAQIVGSSSDKIVTVAAAEDGIIAVVDQKGVVSVYSSLPVLKLLKKFTISEDDLTQTEVKETVPSKEDSSGNTSNGSATLIADETTKPSADVGGKCIANDKVENREKGENKPPVKLRHSKKTSSNLALHITCSRCILVPTDGNQGNAPVGYFLLLGVTYESRQCIAVYYFANDSGIEQVPLKSPKSKDTCWKHTAFDINCDDCLLDGFTQSDKETISIIDEYMTAGKSDTPKPEQVASRKSFCQAIELGNIDGSVSSRIDNILYSKNHETCLIFCTKSSTDSDGFEHVDVSDFSSSIYAYKITSDGLVSLKVQKNFTEDIITDAVIIKANVVPRQLSNILQVELSKTKKFDLLAVGCSKGVVHLLCAEDLQLLQDVTLVKKPQRLEKVLYCPDLARIVGCCADGALVVYDFDVKEAADALTNEDIQALPDIYEKGGIGKVMQFLKYCPIPRGLHVFAPVNWAVEPVVERATANGIPSKITHQCRAIRTTLVGDNAIHKIGTLMESNSSLTTFQISVTAETFIGYLSIIVKLDSPMIPTQDIVVTLYGTQSTSDSHTGFSKGPVLCGPLRFRNFCSNNNTVANFTLTSPRMMLTKVGHFAFELKYVTLDSMSLSGEASFGSLPPASLVSSVSIGVYQFATAQKYVIDHCALVQSLCHSVKLLEDVLSSFDDDQVRQMTLQQTWSSMEFLVWLSQIKIWCASEESNHFLLAISKAIPNLVEQCLIRGDRTSAHRFAQLVCSILGFPDCPGKTNVEESLKEAMSSALLNVYKAQSSAAIRWLFSLFELIPGSSSQETKRILQDQLLALCQVYIDSRSHHHVDLDERFGITSGLLDPIMTEPQNLLIPCGGDARLESKGCNSKDKTDKSCIAEWCLFTNSEVSGLLEVHALNARVKCTSEGAQVQRLCDKPIIGQMTDVETALDVNTDVTAVQPSSAAGKMSSSQTLMPKYPPYSSDHVMPLEDDGSFHVLDSHVHKMMVLSNSKSMSNNAGPQSSKAKNEQIFAALQDEYEAENAASYGICPQRKQLCLLVERMHVGSHHSVTLEFADTVQVTDIYIPQNVALSKISVFVWQHGEEETDATFVTCSSSIATCALVLQDSLPCIECKFMKIVVVGSHSQGTTKAVIPLGQFYGRPVRKDEDPSQNSMILNNVFWNYCQVSHRLVNLLYQDIDHHPEPKDFKKNLMAACLETSSVQMMLNSMANLSWPMPTVAASDLHEVCHDKLRVLIECILEALVAYRQSNGCRMEIATEEDGVTLDDCLKIFYALCTCGPYHLIELACISFDALHLRKSWWPSFLAKCFETFFHENMPLITLCNRIFPAYMMLMRLALDRFDMIKDVFNELSSLLSRLEANPHSKQNRQRIDWLLLVLNRLIDYSDQDQWTFITPWESMCPRTTADGNENKPQTNSQQQKSQPAKQQQQQQQQKLQTQASQMEAAIDHAMVFSQPSGPISSEQLELLKYEGLPYIKALIDKALDCKLKSPPSKQVGPPPLPPSRRDKEQGQVKPLPRYLLGVDVPKETVITIAKVVFAVILNHGAHVELSKLLLACKVVSLLPLTCKSFITLDMVLSSEQIYQLMTVPLCVDQTEREWVTYAISCVLRIYYDHTRNLMDVKDRTQTVPLEIDSEKKSQKMPEEAKDNIPCTENAAGSSSDNRTEANDVSKCEHAIADLKLTKRELQEALNFYRLPLKPVGQITRCCTDSINRMLERELLLIPTNQETRVQARRDFANGVMVVNSEKFLNRKFNATPAVIEEDSFLQLEQCMERLLGHAMSNCQALALYMQYQQWMPLIDAGRTVHSGLSNSKTLMGISQLLNGDSSRHAWFYWHSLLASQSFLSQSKMPVTQHVELLGLYSSWLSKSITASPGIESDAVISLVKNGLAFDSGSSASVMPLRLSVKRLYLNEIQAYHRNHGDQHVGSSLANSIASILCNNDAFSACSDGEEMSITLQLIEAIIGFVGWSIALNEELLQEEIRLVTSTSRSFIIHRGRVLDQADTNLQFVYANHLRSALRLLDATIDESLSNGDDLNGDQTTVAELYDATRSLRHVVNALNVYSLAFDKRPSETGTQETPSDSNTSPLVGHQKMLTLLDDLLSMLTRHSPGKVAFFEAISHIYFPRGSVTPSSRLSSDIKRIILAHLEDGDLANAFLTCGLCSSICRTALLQGNSSAGTAGSSFSVIKCELNKQQKALADGIKDTDRNWKLQRRCDGMQNFAPFSEISGPSGSDPLDVLLKAKTPHRRIRFAAFSYKVAPDANPWITIDMKLPCVILVKEISIIMHQSYIGGCPLKVRVELSDNGEIFVPHCQPLLTSGRSVISIVFAKCELAKTVRLHLHAPVDLSFKLNLIEVFGSTSFAHNDTKLSTKPSYFTFLDWIDVLSAACESSPHLLQEVRKHLSGSNLMRSAKLALGCCFPSQRWSAVSFYVDAWSYSNDNITPVDYNAMFPGVNSCGLMTDECLTPSLLQEFLMAHMETTSFSSFNAQCLLNVIQAWFSQVMSLLDACYRDEETVHYLNNTANILRMLSGISNVDKEKCSVDMDQSLLFNVIGCVASNFSFLTAIGSVLDALSLFNPNLLKDIFTTLDSQCDSTLLVIAHACLSPTNVDLLLASRLPHNLCQEVIDTCNACDTDWFTFHAFKTTRNCLRALAVFCDVPRFVHLFGCESVLLTMRRVLMLFLDNVDVFKLHMASELFVQQFFMLQEVSTGLLKRSIGRHEEKGLELCRDVIDLMQIQLHKRTNNTHHPKTFLDHVVLQLIVKERFVTVTLLPRQPVPRSGHTHLCRRLQFTVKESVTIGSLQSAILLKSNGEKVAATEERNGRLSLNGDPSLTGSEYCLYSAGLASIDLRKKHTDGKKTTEATERKSNKTTLSALFYSMETPMLPLDQALPIYKVIDSSLDRQLSTNHLTLEYELIQWHSSAAQPADDATPMNGNDPLADSLLPDRHTLLDTFTDLGGLHLLALNYRRRLEKNECNHLCSNSVTVVGQLLLLPGYGQELLKCRKEADCILRLMLNVEETATGEKLASSKMASGLPIVPYVVLHSLLKNSALASGHGQELRHIAFKESALDMVLAKLASVTSDSTQMMSEFPKGSAAKSMEGQDYWAKGTGFGTGSTMSNWNVEKSILKKKREEEHVVALLSVIASFINPMDELWLSGDALVNVLPESLAKVCLASCLRDVLAGYLRNDSVLDMARHVPLYRAVMDVLKAIVSLPTLIPMVLPSSNLGPLANETSALSFLLTKMKRCVDTYSSRLKVSTAKAKLPSRRLKGGRKSTTPSSSSNGTNELDESQTEHLSLLIQDINTTLKAVQEKVTDYKNRFEESKQKTGKPDQDDGNSEAALEAQQKCSEADYVAKMKDLQFDTFEIVSESDDGQLTFATPFHYQQIVRSSKNEGSASRARRIAQEVASLSTSLPLSYGSTVFLRCDENRLDVMKVLITGPEDTPYANGCFEFDVYFPVDYPTSPMMVNLHTTGKHSVRFNPNLYNDGKVCLSILNTWHGRPEEKWNPQTSNLLQVLVSMQSLILVPDPYFNEPGYERSRGTKAGDHNSNEYNANIRQATVKWAMLEQLRKPSSCFKEIIHTHFKAKSDHILHQLASWVEVTEKQAPDSNTIALHLASLKKHAGMLKHELKLLADGKLPEPSSAATTANEPVPVPVKTGDEYEFTDSCDSDSLFLFL